MLVIVQTGSPEMQVLTWDDMNLVLRKPVFGVSDQVLHKPGCAATEDG